jgi:predicted DNA-binding transcriptional regulator AlpA
MSDRLLTFPDLKPLKGIPYTRQHIDRLERAGQWPQRVQVGPNRVAWWESEIDERNANLPRGPLVFGGEPSWAGSRHRGKASK